MNSKARKVFAILILALLLVISTSSYYGIKGIDNLAYVVAIGLDKGDNEKIKLIEPLEVIDFHNFMNKAYLILTDSGGIQEEAPSLGKPVLVLRDTTERPEGIEAGTLKLVGTDERNVYKNIKKLLDNKEEYQKMSKASNPYGDGKACEKIADIIENKLK